MDASSIALLGTSRNAQLKPGGKVFCGCRVMVRGCVPRYTASTGGDHMPNPGRPRMGQGQATSRRRTLGDGTMNGNQVERQYNERSMASAPCRMTSSRAVVLLASILLFAGCSGAATAPRPAERPTISQYKGWTISVTPSQSATTRWRARVRMWPPEVRPDQHPGILLRFDDAAADRRAVEQAATAAAHRYIDASQPVHQR